MEKGIFDGLKVLDCASFIAAPAAATVLSDFGADVIKIEPPGAGDPYRNLPNLPGYPHSEHNFAWMLEARNKKSLALDLSKPEGQAVLHRLAATLCGEIAATLDLSDDRRVEPLVQRDGVPDVVVVAVRDEDQVDALGALLGLGALRIPLEERVDVDTFPARAVEAEAGVAEPSQGDVGHALLLGS